MRYRWSSMFAMLAVVALALSPVLVPLDADAAPKKKGPDGGIAYFDLQDPLDPLFGSAALCHITCANGDHHHTDADDQDECTADCNEVCNTTSCPPPPQ